MKKLFCLVLNRAFLPFDVIPWQKAVTLEWLGRCLVIEYHPTEKIRSPSREFPVPIVVRVNSIRSVVVTDRPTRMMIYYRDNFRCAYCGKTLRDHELTIDHVVPRSRGGKWSWENLVTSCINCNRAKKQAIWIPRYTEPVKPRFLFTKYLKIAKDVDPKTREMWKKHLSGFQKKALP